MSSGISFSKPASLLLVCLLAPAAVAVAQENPLSAYNKRVYSGLKPCRGSSSVRNSQKLPYPSRRCHADTSACQLRDQFL